MASTNSRQDSRRPFRLIVDFCSTAAGQQTEFNLEGNTGLGAEAVLGHARTWVHRRRARNRIRTISRVVSTLSGRFETGSSVLKGRVRQKEAP